MRKVTLPFLMLILLLAMSCSRERNIYVSPSGNDSNDGSMNHPFLTLEKAKDAVRIIQKQNPGTPITVNIKGGVYELNNPVKFDTEDSDSSKAPVVYKAVGDEEPIFTGSKKLEHWQLLKNDEKLAALDPSFRGKIFVTDLKSAGISNFGDPIEEGNRPDLNCDGQLQTLARWPNSGFTRSGKAKGKTEIPPGYNGVKRKQEGIFEYVDERQDKWTNEKEGCVEGYWHWDWKDEYNKIEKVDPVTNTLLLKEPYHKYGYKDSLRYFGLNLFCEIDQPTEWFLDRNEGLLYWYPPEGVNPELANVTLSILNAPYMVEIKDCANLQLKGLTFQESRGNGILISGGENCRITDCRLLRFGSEGIHIEGGTGHGIEGCFLNSFGCGGIVLNGGDRRTLTHAGFFVENTVVENFSLFRRTYEPAVYVEGCGFRISNNRFRFSSSSAMRLEGNDIVIENNEISDVVMESDDQGGLDMWFNPSLQGIVIRYNRWTDINGKGGENGSAGVRLDDMISGVQIFGNLFERCGSVIFGAIQVHGGKENVIENNLFYQCYAAYSFTSWDKQRWLNAFQDPRLQKKIYEEVDIRSPQYQAKYPILKDLNSNLNINTVQNNLIIDCNQEIIRDEKRVNNYKNNTFLSADGKNIEYFFDADILKEYGLKPIPVEQMGPKNNKWIK